MRLLSTALITLFATSVAADVSVTFRDGAPKDRFAITNTADCETAPFDLTIDLVGSPSNLIFDITGDGAGVEVFQPFELVSGSDSVLGVSDVSDGDTMLTLSMAALPAGGGVAFTIDLDDTVGTREITVSGSEIEGASIAIQMGDQASTGIFDAQGQATAVTEACRS
ncbi:MAG: hypothetical protein ACSHWY_06030 [Octadecabacter sp.]